MTTLQGNQFSRSIFYELDEKLYSTAWNSSISEAHGLLTGLACRGINKNSLPKMKYLFQVTDPTEWIIFASLFEMILSDLESDEPLFNLLLPESEDNISASMEHIENWCSGFTQGFCYDLQQQQKSMGEETKEILSDIMTIASMESALSAQNSGQDGLSLFEIEEYLRVGIQLIYESEGIVNDTTSQPVEHPH